MPACRHFSESSWKALAVMVRMGMVWAFRQLSIGLLGNFKGNGNDKGGANAHQAGHLNGAVHLVDQTLYNGHARSLVYTAGIAVLLGKGSKEPLQEFLAHSDTGIGNRPAVGTPSVFRPHILHHDADNFLRQLRKINVLVGQNDVSVLQFTH